MRPSRIFALRARPGWHRFGRDRLA